ncbi:hypothetical protein MITS9509_02761 [Synechococcus sp. MIT S9509]|nr:hypothetical protein MITS9504_02115 [Synechococcus sp. MIT S9504]KZR90472.1 hypothetical protein MITS9509_02761 [Synechococcus sp. MIT S9509]
MRRATELHPDRLEALITYFEANFQSCRRQEFLGFEEVLNSWGNWGRPRKGLMIRHSLTELLCLWNRSIV